MHSFMLNNDLSPTPCLNIINLYIRQISQPYVVVQLPSAVDRCVSKLHNEYTYCILLRMCLLAYHDSILFARHLPLKNIQIKLARVLYRRLKIHISYITN